MLSLLKIPVKKTGDGKDQFEKASDLFSRLEEKYQQLTLLQKEISQVRPWGDFSKKDPGKTRIRGYPC